MSVPLRTLFRKGNSTTNRGAPMSLNITVLSRNVIYQSGDFRLVDSHSRRATFEAQKQVQITRFRWSAVVGFIGIGAVGRLRVSDWLAKKAEELPAKSEFDDLIEVLLSADDWIQRLPLDRRFHTFSVGAFIGHRPLFALVSNFESVHARPSRKARPHLRATYVRPSRERVIVTGRPEAVERLEKLKLVGKLRAKAPPEAVMNELAIVNASAHTRDPDFISRACATSFVRSTGEGGGKQHGGSQQLSILGPNMGLGIAEMMKKLSLPGHPTGNFTTMRSASSEAELRARIREKPDDASNHNNYGAYLRDVTKDDARAEQEYLRALELDPDHAPALGNLALLLTDRGDLDRAEDMHFQAVAAAANNDNLRANLVEFLRRQRGDIDAALRVCEAGNPTASGDPHLFEEHGLLLILKRDYARAADQYERVYKMRPDLAGVAFDYGTVLQCVGAPPAKIEPLYRQVLAQEPGHAPAMLNLAQVRFQLGATQEAIALLRQALKGELQEGQKVEALFCWFAFENRREALHELRGLLTRGARSKGWDLTPVVETAVALGHGEDSFLRALAAVVVGEADVQALDASPRWRELET
jgi:Flp pilus assembly protein TadD